MRSLHLIGAIFLVSGPAAMSWPHFSLWQYIPALLAGILSALWLGLEFLMPVSPFRQKTAAKTSDP